MKMKQYLFINTSCGHTQSLHEALTLKLMHVMKKIIISIIVLVGSHGLLHGQQEPNFTLYMLNPLVYNPALAGTANFYQIRTNHRFQWVGMKNAPITNSFSAFGPHSTKSMGFGGSIYNDITGPTSRIAVNGLYGYNMSINRDIRISYGLTLGLLQYKIDGTNITTHDPDPVLQNSIYTSLVPDASAGIYVYSSSLGFYGGLSGLHLLDIFSKDKAKNIDGINILNTHFYLIGGYQYHVVPRVWMLEPCIILKKVIPASYQFEFSAKAQYKGMLWGGLAFRTSDAFSVVIGYIHERKIHIGYAFDLALNDVRKYTTGSHEIVLGYNFTTIRKNTSKKK